MLVGISKDNKIQYRRGFIELSTIENELKEKYQVEEIILPFDLKDGFWLHEVQNSDLKGKSSFVIENNIIKEKIESLYFVRYDSKDVLATQEQILFLEKFLKGVVIDGKIYFLLKDEDESFLNLCTQNKVSSYFEIFMNAPTLNSNLLLSKTKDVKEMRKLAEQGAFIIYKNKKILLEEKAVSILSTYINTNMENVVWKCENDEWLLLNKTDMINILNDISQIKKSLFEKEFQGGE